MLQRLLFGNFRLVYRISRMLRNRFTINGLTVLTAAMMAGVFGFDTRQTLSFQIFSLLLSVLLISLLCSLFFRGRFSIRRYLPDYATAGQSVTYELLIRNLDDSVQADLSIQDELASPLPSFEDFKNTHDPLDEQRNWFDRFIGYPRLMNLIQRRRGGFIQAGGRFHIREHGMHRVSSTLVPVHRGYLEFSGIRLSKPDPLGLANAIRHFPVRDKLLIFPRYVSLGKIILPGSRKYQPRGRAISGTVGESEEFLSLREYRAGDPLKKIHWKSFARLNTPVIKEYHDEYCVRQGLILDTWNLGKDDSLFEVAVSTAASFAISCIQQDSILDLMFVGDKPYRFNAGRGSMTLQNMLEVLACVSPSGDNNLEQLQRLTIDCIDECSVYICVLLAWDEARKKLIRTLRQHGMTVLCVVMVQDAGDDQPDLEPMLNTPQYFHQVSQSSFEQDLLGIGQTLNKS